MQEKLFMDESQPIPKFTEEGIRPEPKKPWEIRQEEFEKKWKYGSTTVYWYGQYFFVGDIEHCGMESIFFNATKMRDYMSTRGLKSGHMNYNDPPTYEKSFDKNAHDKEMELYKYKTYTWNGGEPLEVENV